MKTKGFQTMYSLFIQKIKFLSWALCRAWGNREQQDNFFGLPWPLCTTKLKFILRWRKQHKWEKWLEWGTLRSGRDCSQVESTFSLKGTAVIQGQPLLCASCNCHVTQECRPMLISSSNFSRESRNPNFHVNSFDVDLKTNQKPCDGYTTKDCR